MGGLARRHDHCPEPWDLANHTNQTVITMWAWPASLGCWSLCCRFELGRLREAVPDHSQFASTGSVAQITKMANAHKAFGQDVHEKPSHELLSLQPLSLDPGVVAVIFISERDLVTVHRSEEHTSELQSRPHLVCRLLLEKKRTS